MKIPRNLSANELIKSLEKVGYLPTRQSGSHIRLTTQQNGQHHITTATQSAANRNIIYYSQ